MNEESKSKLTEKQAISALKRKKDVCVSKNGNIIYRLHENDETTANDIGNKCNGYIDFLTKKCGIVLRKLYRNDFNKMVQANR